MDKERQSKRNTLQVWYADDLSLAFTFSRIKAWFVELIGICPTIGYHPKHTKCFLVISTGNIKLVKSFFT